jgi:hypothetical protein
VGWGRCIARATPSSIATWRSKVPPDLFASDTERLGRFTREAQTLVSLNHPNIAHINGVEESWAVHALVMELVEGKDLSQRIARGANPLDEALPIEDALTAPAVETAQGSTVSVAARSRLPWIALGAVAAVGMVAMAVPTVRRPREAPPEEWQMGHKSILDSPTITTTKITTSVERQMSTSPFTNAWTRTRLHSR